MISPYLPFFLVLAKDEALVQAELEYTISDCIENRSSVSVIEETGANISFDDNSEYFNKDYMLV